MSITGLLYWVPAARLRPILMTSLAMIVGLLPLMLAIGVGAHGNRTSPPPPPRTGKLSAIGGMLIGMIFQIFIVPALFVVFQYFQEKVQTDGMGRVWITSDDMIEQYTK